MIEQNLMLSLQPDTRGGLARRLLAWRPELATETLLLLVSLYFVLACNIPFWQALLAGREITSLPAIGYALAVGGALVSLQFVMVGLVLARWNAKPLLALLILVAAVSSYFTGVFGIYFDPSMLRNVLRTDMAEAREFFTPALLEHLLWFALLPLLLLQRVRLRRRGRVSATLLRGGLLLLVLLVGVGALLSVFKDFSGQMRNHKEIRYLITPASALYSFARVLGKEAQAADRPRTSVGEDARLGARWGLHHKPVLFVMVVGETARAANWGLNGGKARNTTPELARRDVINFPEVSSCGTNTEASVPCLFSMRGRRDYDEDAIRGSESLLHVLQHAGLRVVWSDNQSGCKGVCDGLEVRRPDQAVSPTLCDGERCLDAVLLDGAEQLLADADGNLVLVQHQLGNHGPAYYKRYPAEFRRFTPTCDSEDLAGCTREEIANSYDNALLYTDHVLANTIDWLRQVQPEYDTALLYVSDHGESLGENGLFLHGMPYAIAPREQTRVPMLMWFSPGYSERFGLDLTCLRVRAGMPISHDHISHTLLGLLDVNTRVRTDALDLSAGCRG